MDIKWVGSPNYGYITPAGTVEQKGRGGNKPAFIVDHITQGLMPWCLQWLQDPDTEASSNYLIGRNGTIYQLVKNEDTPWTNGIITNDDNPITTQYPNVYINALCLTIEHEGISGEPLTDEQYQATLWLHRKLIQEYDILVDENHIIGHYRIDPANKSGCPGPAFPWDRLFADLTPIKKHWAQTAHDELRNVGILASNHTIMLDKPATEGVLFQVIYNTLKYINK